MLSTPIPMRISHNYGAYLNEPRHRHSHPWTWVIMRSSPSKLDPTFTGPSAAYSVEARSGKESIDPLPATDVWAGSARSGPRSSG